MVSINRIHCLNTLCQAPAGEVKDFVEGLLPALEPVGVVKNRTGLVMLPMREPVQGVQFYLGEALVAEAHVRLMSETGQAEGYAACLGRDQEQALALAIIDAANAAGLCQAEIAAFLERQALALQEADHTFLQQVEATRVNMETFEWQLSK
ncbi:MAG: phosphonate C-P lyase system protein PhnG [Chloroflexota bacterium]